MSKKKKRKQKEPESLLRGLMRRYRNWPRRVAIFGALAGVVAAVIVFANPFGGAITAIDANGDFSRVDGGTTYDALFQTIEFFLPPEPSATSS